MRIHLSDSRKLPTPESEAFATTLRNSLVLSKQKQVELSRHLKRDPSTIHRYCTGKEVPDRSTMGRILDFFNDSRTREVLHQAYVAVVAPPLTNDIHAPPGVNSVLTVQTVMRTGHLQLARELCRFHLESETDPDLYQLLEELSLEIPLLLGEYTDVISRASRLPNRHGFTETLHNARVATIKGIALRLLGGFTHIAACHELRKASTLLDNFQPRNERESWNKRRVMCRIRIEESLISIAQYERWRANLDLLDHAQHSFTALHRTELTPTERAELAEAECRFFCAQRQSTALLDKLDELKAISKAGSSSLPVRQEILHARASLLNNEPERATHHLNIAASHSKNSGNGHHHHKVQRLLAVVTAHKLILTPTNRQ